MHVPRIIYKEAIYTYIYIFAYYIHIIYIHNTHRFKIIKNHPKSPNILKNTSKTIKNHQKHSKVTRHSQKKHIKNHQKSKTNQSHSQKTYLKTIRTYRKNEILEAPDTRCKLPADVKPSPFTWTFISPEAEEL